MRMKLSALLTKMLGFVGARLLGAGIGFASQLVLARLLPIADVGIVMLGMSAAAFISLGANGGYALLATTQLPKLASRERQRLQDAFNQVAIFDSVLAYALFAALGVVVAAFMDITAGQKTALLIGLLCAPASMAIRYNASVAMAARYFRTAYVPDFLFRPAALLAGLVAASFAGLLHSAFAALIIFTCVTYATAIGQAWALRGKGLGLRHFQVPNLRFARVVRSRAFALTLVSATMLAFADIVVLVAGLLLPEHDVAVVGVCMRLAALAGFVLQAGQMLVLTDFTQAWVKRDTLAVESLLKRINLSTFAIVVLGLLGAVLLGRFALSLFGSDYVEGAPLLVLFMIGQSIRALGGMNQQILSINGHQIRTAGSCLLALVILFTSAVLLCSRYGFIGMGYAVLLAETAWLLALASQAAKLCGRRGDVLWVFFGK
jgi:O-antigen/teichoic acid export membrane protein